MPDLSEYQNVFRVAKPSTSKRSGQTKKGKHHSNGASVIDESGSLDDKDNVSKAQARLQKLEDMVTMLMQANRGTGTVVKDGQPTPPYGDCSADDAAAGMQPALVPCSSAESSLSTPDAPSTGHLHVRGTETNYLGATHWAAILENVCPHRLSSKHLLFLTIHRSKTYRIS